jgi:F-type H+-transporting ATPase subunit b
MIEINAEFWVAVAFVIFVAIMLYMGLHRTILDALDQRTARIKAELEEALRLKEEAKNLLASYQRRHETAEHEAEAIMASARTEAERLAAEAKAKVEELIARRTKMAEIRIGQAEQHALAEVRAAAADAAVAAAATILAESAKGKVADDLIAKGIGDVKAKLN